MINKRKTQSKGRRISVLRGVIRITAKPIGFVLVEKSAPAKGRSKVRDDIIVFEENLNCALDKDEVEVEIVGQDRYRKKGRVVKIIKRNKTEFVGTLEKKDRGFVFIPDDYRFYKKVEISQAVDVERLEEGLKVLVEINWTNPNLNPKGKILKIIGKKGEHETEMQSILLDKGIVYEFHPEVEREAERVAEIFRRQERFLSGNPKVSSLRALGLSSWNFITGSRADFRDITTFTIDPVDAKDFDDALSYDDLGGGKLRVGVHIADVSHFVLPNSALDREARKRGFSTYLVDRTIPMLPEILSNDLCSLNPNVDRFAFSAVFDIEKSTGKVLDRWFGKTIINSNKRFSYEKAQELLNESQQKNISSKKSSGLLADAENFSVGPKTDPESSFLPSPDQKGGGCRPGGVFGDALQNLNRIAKIYREENKKNGAIEFETDEVKFELDNKGKPIRIYKKPRLDTMKMIEDWMLLANREVAKFISDKVQKRGGTGLFRIHDLPNVEKLEELSIFVKALGHNLPIGRGGYVSAKDLNILLSEIEGHSAESLIKTAVIHSMAKAEYSTKNIGHYGLAFEYYTHFTSPIRRYPDLLVHRILSSYLENRPIPKNEFSKFEKIAQETSEKEIEIAEAERASIKYKQVEFMMDKIGQEFDVVISGVTEWGMYVENPETKVEGLVRIKDLGDDFYKLDQKNYCIKGEHTKKKFSLGDSLRVKLISANLDRKTLDFKLVS